MFIKNQNLHDHHEKCMCTKNELCLKKYVKISICTTELKFGSIKISYKVNIYVCLSSNKKSLHNFLRYV